ncbi:hypothetical protein BKD03_09555 [Brucella sp. 09RB8471]|nr:hypothetical protein BKD03_09555 [Brucella sp. 09RB8471]
MEHADNCCGWIGAERGGVAGLYFCNAGSGCQKPLWLTSAVTRYKGRSFNLAKCFCEIGS